MGEELRDARFVGAVWEHTPPGNFWNLGLLRWILMQSETHLCNCPSENSL